MSIFKIIEGESNTQGTEIALFPPLSLYIVQSQSEWVLNRIRQLSVVLAIDEQLCDQIY